jgi:hypothetical protein
MSPEKNETALFSPESASKAPPNDGFDLQALVLPAVLPVPPRVQQVLATTFKRLLVTAQDKSKAWASRGVHDDVAMMSRAPEAGSNIRCFKGHGPIDASADRVAEKVMDLGSTVTWDPLFKCGVVIERYEDGSVLRYVVYQAQQCLAKASRNFVYVMGRKKLPDGTQLIAAVSMDRPDLPVYKGSIRGTIEESGWVIQPFPNTKDKCMCTYVSTVDLGGLPSVIVNIVSSKQPMVVAGVRKALLKEEANEIKN